MSLPNCPECKSDLTYEDGDFLICPMCAHQWKDTSNEVRIWKDANGNELQNGDTVIITKSIKVKGSPNDIKQGMKVKNIRLIEPEDGEHDISCKIDGFGAMLLKTSIVKKA